MKKVVIIDGQGGRIGSQLVAGLKARNLPDITVCAIGTNSVATTAMKRAGADAAATGENAVCVNCRDADVISGPIGIIAADALMGEVSPTMACAVGQSAAQKVLVPVNRCKQLVVGVREMTLSEAVALAVTEILRALTPSA